MKPFVFTALLLMVVFITSGQVIPAADTVNSLPAVEITYRSDRYFPFPWLEMNEADINNKSTGQEPSFILAGTPSLTNYSDAGSTQGYSYFRMRGIDQTRVNITFDGVPLNEPEDQGAYFSNYPDLFNSLGQVHVAPGVGISKNGIASYGGSILLWTPWKRDENTTELGVNYGSFNTMRVYGEHNSVFKGNKTLYTRASLLHSDGYKYHSANTSGSLFLSGASYGKHATWHVTVLGGRQQNQLAWLGVTDSLIRRDPRTNGNTNENDQFDQYLVQLSNTVNLTPSSPVSSSVYYTHLVGGYDLDLNNYLSLPPNGEMYHYAFRSDMVGIFSNYFNHIGAFDIAGGVNGSVYRRQHTGSERSAGQLYTNSGYKSDASGYCRSTFNFRRLHAFADMQYRYVAFNYSGSVPLDGLQWSFLNPKAGISLDVGKNSFVYYSLGYSGREPTRNDIFGGNDDLLADSMGKAITFTTHAEYVTDHEMGWKYFDRQWQVGANVYYMSFKDEIVLSGKFGPNGLALTEQAARSYRAGAELSLRYSLLRHWAFVNNSSFNHSRITQSGVSFAPVLTPAVIVNQECEYSGKNFTIGVGGRYQSSSYIDFANSASVPGYVLLNARGQYTWRHFVIAAFLNNITNQRYYNNGYVDVDGSRKYFVQAPVNYTLSLKYSF